MAKKHWTHYDCEYCGRSSTTETATLRWVRKLGENGGPLSGVTRTDVDQIFWKRRCYGREFRNGVIVMFDLEIKERGASQDDKDIMIWRARSERLRGEWRSGEHLYRHLGCHVWRLGGGEPPPERPDSWLGSDPPHADWMKWDARDIKLETVIEILACERSPDYPYRRISDDGNLDGQIELPTRRRARLAAMETSQPL